MFNIIRLAKQENPNIPRNIKILIYICELGYTLLQSDHCWVNTVLTLECYINFSNYREKIVFTVISFENKKRDSKCRNGDLIVKFMCVPTIKEIVLLEYEIMNPEYPVWKWNGIFSEASSKR